MLHLYINLSIRVIIMPQNHSQKQKPFDATGNIDYNNVRDDHLIFIGGIASLVMAAIVLLNTVLANIYLSLLVIAAVLVVILLATLCVTRISFFHYALPSLAVVMFSLVLFAFTQQHLG